MPDAGTAPAWGLEFRGNGQRLRGFESGKVTQSMDALATTFAAQWSTRTLQGGGDVELEVGDAVEVYAGAELITKGWITGDADSGNQKAERRALTGGSLLQDLVDCAASSSRRVLRDVSLPEIAEALAGPFGVPVEVGDDSAGFDVPFPRVVVEIGQRIGQVLEELARERGAVLLDDAGTLVIDRAGRTSAGTLRKSDTLSFARRREHRNRFSRYDFAGRRRSTPEASGAATQHLVTVEDEGVGRFRPYAEFAPGIRADVERKGTVLRNQRAGRSERVIYQVPGWFNLEGRIWRPNQILTVTDDRVGLDGEPLLIVRTTLFAEQQTRRTTLELTRPEAFDALVTYPAANLGGRR